MQQDKLTEDERRALQFDPFEGDEEAFVERSDVIAVAKKAYTCFTCDGPILPGDRHRARSAISPDETYITNRWCPACVQAMARNERRWQSSYPDTPEGDAAQQADERAWEDRIAIGDRAREAVDAIRADKELR